MAQNYTSQNIQVLEELDAVRLRPGMYIGSTGSRGLHHLLWEIVDNAIDEAANDHATEISVSLHQDGSASVWDNGRGVPVDPHPQLQISGLEVIYTKLHAGGKFDHKNYNYSGGLHGVGASVVNALSKWMTVESFRDWTHWRMRFETMQDKKTGKALPGRPVTALERVGNTRKRGTLVRFLPDDAIFEDTQFNGELVARRLRELAYLNKGLLVKYADERAAPPHNEPRVFQYGGGITDYVAFLNTDKTALHEGVIMLEGKRDKLELSCAIQFTDSYT